jgi:hypothetical protein
MDGTMNKTTFSLLAMASLVPATVTSKARAVVAAQLPEGYEDESGFHFATPTFKN